MPTVREAEAPHIPLSLSVRPPRIMLLVPTGRPQFPSWVPLFEAALASQSRYWGGSANLVIPQTKDFEEHPLFWRLADLYDPDAFAVYAPTHEEWGHFSPKTYREWDAAIREDLTKREFGEDAISEFLERAQGQVRFEPQPLSEVQKKLILGRLAPLHHERGQGWTPKAFNASSVPWPLADISEFQGLPSEVTNPASPPGAARALLTTAALGRVTGQFEAELTKRDISVIKGERLSRYRWAQLVHDRSQGDPRATYPWTVSDQGLGLYRRHSPAAEGSAALVVGDSPWDFALYYALRSMGGLAWWLPSWLTKDASYLHGIAHSMEYDGRRDGTDIAVVSTSSPGSRKRYSERVAEAGVTPNTMKMEEWEAVLPGEPLRFYEMHNQGRVEMISMAAGETLPLDTPLPKKVATEPPLSMRWFVGVAGHDWAPLRHPAITAKIFGSAFSTTDLMRPSREGGAYYALGIMTWGGESLENSVVRPEIRPLSLIDQIRTILPEGWSCEPSDKGVWGQETMKLLGGFEALVVALRDSEFRAITESYGEKSKLGRGLKDGRRYLRWCDLEDAIGHADIGTTVDPLLESGVLARGLILRCERCRLSAWYPVSEVSEDFRCGRCHLHQTAARFSWLGSDEPQWTYRLAEVVYQFFRNNGELPVLAVADAFAETSRPLATANELLFTDPAGDKRELDIVVSDGYQLWLGEATTTGKFGAGRLGFLSRMAEITSAYGVLVATSRLKWTTPVEMEAHNLFGTGWPRLILASGVKTKAT